ncbi:MAG: hypothetical protein ACE5HI_15355 [bacterium]
MQSKRGFLLGAKAKLRKLRQNHFPLKNPQKTRRRRHGLYSVDNGMTRDDAFSKESSRNVISRSQKAGATSLKCDVANMADCQQR